MRNCDMKFLGVILLVFIFCSADLFGQCTPDNTHTEYGAYTSLGKNKIPNCWVDSAFEENVTIVIPTKFNIATISQVTLIDVIGLYTGLSYESNPASKVFPAGQNHCIRIHGTPTDSKQSNQDSVWLSVKVETDIIAEYLDTIGINFNLLDSATLTINDQVLNKQRVFPNPAKYNINFDFGGLVYQTLSIELMDLNGKIIKDLSFDSNENPVRLPIQDIENGIYILKYIVDDKIAIEKITVQH